MIRAINVVDEILDCTQGVGVWTKAAGYRPWAQTRAVCGASHRSMGSGSLLMANLFFGTHGGHGSVRTPHLEDGGDGGGTVPAVQQQKIEPVSVSCLMGFGSLEDKDKALYGPFKN
ncbi:hypothetical protein BY996DRAFT_6417934 [Phakopsora pachyrhizi]|nr:hypothetical protein BY996DRAFT_6417934 [Phakopsora pachyrhizi]